MSNSICIICGSENIRNLRFINIISRYTGIRYPLYRCNSCGLTRPDQNSIKEMLAVKIYEDPKNIRFYDQKKGAIGENEPGYKDYFRHFTIYKDFIKKYNIKGKGLDIGCGAGHLIKVLSNEGITMEGQDISFTLIKALKKQGIRVHSGRLDKIRTKNKYDVITFNQVLEHVEDPEKFIEDVKYLLKNKGHILFAVPYLSGFVPQILRSYWYGLGYGQHLNFFSKKSLELLLKNKGFDLCEFEVLIVDYTHPKFPKALNLAIGMFMNLIVKLNLGDNLFVVARLNKK